MQSRQSRFCASIPVGYVVRLTQQPATIYDSFTGILKLNSISSHWMTQNLMKIHACNTSTQTKIK